MRILFLALIFLALPGSAFAEKVIFMLNMNYSSQELAALREVAKDRGQKVVMVPPESLIPEAEELFDTRTAMEKKVKALRPNLNDSQVRMQVADYMRKGLASTRDESLNQALAKEAEDLHRKSMRLSEKEQKNGPVVDQIRKKLDELQAKGQEVDTVVFSAHSDGSNLSGETSNRLSSSDITSLSQDHPELFADPRHVLLLGCYNMTETNHFRWRHELFRGASLIAGFGVRAPGRNRKINHDFIRGVLGTADKLDQQMVKKNSPLDKGYVDKVFKQLAAVTGTQSVLDYCVQIIEGEPGSRSLSCEQQWTIFMAQAKMIQADYLDLRHLQKDPPQDDDGTELRSFYNTLQNTCPAREASQIPRNEVEKAERYRVSLRESLIRLIYWWNVQKNFRTYFALDLEELNTVLDRLGVKQKVPALDGTTGRIEYVQAYNKIYQALRGIESDIDHQRVQLSGASNYTARRRLDEEERLLDAARDRFKYLYPLYAMEGEDSVGEGKGPSTAVTLSRGGIPFHWIEPGAVLEPRRSK